jgi:nucleoid-associated protein YgaU
VRRPRSSLRIPPREAVCVACAALTLGLGVGCGAGGAAAPTPTVVPSAAVSPVPASSPQRPPLASPVPSPSVAAVAATTPTATTAEAAGETYEVKSGDTLLSIAEQFYGDATQWRRIYDANRDVIGPDPDKLTIQMKLRIPPKQP